MNNGGNEWQANDVFYVYFLFLLARIACTLCRKERSIVKLV